MMGENFKPKYKTCIMRMRSRTTTQGYERLLNTPFLDFPILSTILPEMEDDTDPIPAQSSSQSTASCFLVILREYECSPMFRARGKRKKKRREI
jgi:hypothetical protein